MSKRPFMMLAALLILTPMASAEAAGPRPGQGALSGARPEEAPATRTGAPQRAHVVRPGDTLREVAARHGVRVAELREWNRLGRNYRLQVDGMLRLSAPAAPLPSWRTRTETVTAVEANGDPAKACPVQPADLRRIWVRYLDYEGVARDGNLIVHRSVAVPVQRAFAKLYHWRFPIMVMEPIAVNLPGLTDRSVLTSGYECRYVAGTTTWSQHSYGLAVDVNPRQNPMIRGTYPNHTYLDPPNSATWLARDHFWPGMVHDGGAVRAFTANGFAWGGRWTSLKDYMHFSTTDR